MEKFKIKMSHLFHRKESQSQQPTQQLPIRSGGSSIKHAMRIVLALVFIMTLSITVSANGDPLQTVNNLSDFLFSLIRAIGLILLGFGIVQIGMSLKSHDPSQRSNGFLTLAGGVIIFFTREILNLITG